MTGEVKQEFAANAPTLKCGSDIEKLDLGPALKDLVRGWTYHPEACQLPIDLCNQNSLLTTFAGKHALPPVEPDLLCHGGKCGPRSKTSIGLSPRMKMQLCNQHCIRFLCRTDRDSHVVLIVSS
jgi:hypothetical protein